MSEEDEKRHTRREIIQSFLDAERSYVALLGSLVEVSLSVLHCTDVRQTESLQWLLVLSQAQCMCHVVTIC